MKLAVRAALLTLVLILQVLVCCSSEDRQSKDNDGHDQNADLVVKTIKRPKKCEVKAKPGDSLRVHYVGRLGDRKGKVFDSSRDRGFTFNFKLGEGQAIQGYEQGLVGMCKGEKRSLLVPPSLAYGERGVPGVIPGGATLHFQVELVKLIEGEPLAAEEEKESHSKTEL